MMKFTWIFTTLVLVSCSKVGRSRKNNEACLGTSYGRSTVEDDAQRYNILKTLYTNCTYLEGNLEISYQQDITEDFSFLKDIREVTGYVLISLSYLRTAMLPNLRVIRGTTLLEGNALIISHNYDKQNLDVGLHELQLRSLQEIIRGNVTIEKNNRLCFADTIDWDDIISPGAIVTIAFDESFDQRTCPPCNNPNGGGCWGEGPENFQQLSKTTCDRTCDYRCRGPTAADCCHKSCAAGCTGPLNTECFACRNFTSGDECLDSCPPRYIYDPSSYSNVLNPNFRYSYGAQCIEKCPSNFLTESDTCVKQCDVGNEEKDGLCVDCDGPCPKTCEGLEKTESLNALNYEGLKGGCTIIQKNIIIGTVTFMGDLWNGIPPLKPEDLEIFKTVKVINGFLSVQAQHAGLTDLSIFENLTEIKGREHYSPHDASLSILGTNLESLGLTSLKEISKGNVLMIDNRKLCYVGKSMWNEFLSNPRELGGDQAFYVDKLYSSNCIAEGRVCDNQCVEIGCWGPGPEQCVRCKNKKIGTKCVEDCDYENGEYYVGNATCEFCHEECSGRCSGPGNDKCNQCKNFKDGPFCVLKCPGVKYNNSGICLPCHENCIQGCTGPLNTIGENACNDCAKVKLDREDKLIKCLPGGAFGINRTCDEGYFYERLFDGSGTRTQNCRECHLQCRDCTAKGSYNCSSCKNFKRDDQCVSSCYNEDEYYNDRFECQLCHQQCKGGCNGPTARDCKSKCRHYKLLLKNGEFECTDSCSEEYPYEDEPYHCVSNCPEDKFLNENNTCRLCHSECVGGCTGDQRTDCITCKGFIHNGECREVCPLGTVPDGNVCQKVNVTSTDSSTDTPKSGLSSPLIAGISCLIVILIILILINFYIIYKRKYQYQHLPKTPGTKESKHLEENEML